MREPRSRTLLPSSVPQETLAPQQSLDPQQAPDPQQALEVPWRRLTHPGTTTGERALPSWRRLVLSFLAAALTAAFLAGALASVITQRLERQETLDEGIHLANLMAEAIIEPELTDDLMVGQPRAVQLLDRQVRRLVLPYGVVRVNCSATTGW